MRSHGQKRSKTFENDKKGPFSSCAREAHVRGMKKKANVQPAFRCQPAFGSHSQSLTNKLFSLFFFMRLI